MAFGIAAIGFSSTFMNPKCLKSPMNFDAEGENVKL